MVDSQASLAHPRWAAFIFTLFCVSNVHICARTHPFIPLWNTDCRSCCSADPPPPPPPPPCNWTGSCRRANKERLAGSQNGERGRGRVVLSNLPQVSHMTQAIRAGRPWRLGQLATVSGCLAWTRYQVIVTGMRKNKQTASARLGESVLIRVKRASALLTIRLGGVAAR